jgi:hypothetical protein
MPEISRGIRDWIEAKIWRLLVVIGEPEHRGYSDQVNDYWDEAK